MKALKIIGAVVLVLAVIIGVLAMLAPGHQELERSVEINAPGDLVWDQISTFKKMQEWSPWAAAEPNQVVEYSDNDGEVGSTMDWSGDMVGVGRQTMTGLTENSIETHLEFLEPWFMSGEADAAITMTQEGENTTVSWSYSADAGFPGNVMGLFFDVEAMLGEQYQKGLDSLKTLVESNKSSRTEFGGYEIRRETMEARTVIGTRDTITWDEMKGFYEENLPKAAMAIAENGMEMAGMPMGVFFFWDYENQTTELLAGAPIAEGSIEGMDSYTIGGECLVVDYYGPYEGSEKAHNALGEYMKWHGIEMGEVAIEEYITDPGQEPDQSKWLTKVMYAIK